KKKKYRKIILDYLSKNLQESSYLIQLSEEITNYMEREKKLEEKSRSINLKSTHLERNRTELVVRKQKQVGISLVAESKKSSIKEKITKLEEEIKDLKEVEKLQEEIQKTGKDIREMMHNHVLQKLILSTRGKRE